MISSAGLLKRLEKLEETGLGLTASERDVDVRRKRAKRSEAVRIFIPSCVNPQRRERCLADPELFLKTYFPRRYTKPFGKLHHAMIEAMVQIATDGGKQAIAAPRGRGKSEITRGMLVYLLCAFLVRFPVIVCQTTADARRTYHDFRRKLMTNELLAEDFPEICTPVRELEGAPQRASKQHIDSKLTGIAWTAEALRLANVPEKYRIGPDFGGFRMEYRGLDASIRGLNSEGDRPDLIIIDDPETHESAKSQAQVDDRINAIEQDIAGLADDPDNLSQVMLTTIQNRYCLSFQYTDPSQKASWMGRRFAWVESWPDEWNKDGKQGEGLWSEYIALRGADQRDGDRYGRRATQLFLDNREAMERGGELLADNYNAKTLPDGWQTIHSAWQVVFNTIADTNYDAFCTEYQNDPPELDQVETSQLTAAKVMARLVSTGQREAPQDAGIDTIGIDMGKYASHWAHTSWTDQGCVGTVPDYGVVETVGLNAESDNTAIEHALVSALEIWGEEVRDKVKPQLVLVDSGNWAEAAYEFCRRMGRPFFPAKGWEPGRFRLPKERTTEKIPYEECYAAWQHSKGLWLYHMQGEHWKSWLQSRFLQRTLDEAGNRVPGSLALFDPLGDNKRHLSFAQHMVAEEEQFVPKDGKALQRRWFVKNRNNHWLDAMAMATCAAGCLGVKLIQPTAQKAAAVVKKTEQKASPFMVNGRPFVASQR